MLSRYYWHGLRSYLARSLKTSKMILATICYISRYGGLHPKSRTPSPKFQAKKVLYPNRALKKCQRRTQISIFRDESPENAQLMVSEIRVKGIFYVEKPLNVQDFGCRPPCKDNNCTYPSKSAGIRIQATNSFNSTFLSYS